MSEMWATLIDTMGRLAAAASCSLSRVLFPATAPRTDCRVGGCVETAGGEGLVWSGYIFNVPSVPSSIFRGRFRNSGMLRMP